MDKRRIVSILGIIIGLIFVYIGFSKNMSDKPQVSDDEVFTEQADVIIDNN